MTPGYALFFSCIIAYGAVLVISFGAGKLGKGLSCTGMVYTGLIAFVAAGLFLLFAPETMYVPAALIFVGIVTITLIIFWITGR